MISDFDEPIEQGQTSRDNLRRRYGLRVPTGHATKTIQIIFYFNAINSLNPEEGKDLPAT